MKHIAHGWLVAVCSSYSHVCVLGHVFARAVCYGALCSLTGGRCKPPVPLEQGAKGPFQLISFASI